MPGGGRVCRPRPLRRRASPVGSGADGLPVALPPLPAPALRRGPGPGPPGRGPAQRGREATGSATPTCSAAPGARARPRPPASWPRCSTARTPVDGEPCGVCESCLAIEHGTSFDVHELDAASNNGVEAIRDLIAKTAMGTPGRTKVYILDEVHMLSTAGVERAAEDPGGDRPSTSCSCWPPPTRRRCCPPSAAAPSTSRCTCCRPRSWPTWPRFIIDDAGLDVGPEAVDYVVRAGAGSARDMESALDQVAARRPARRGRRPRRAGRGPVRPRHRPGPDRGRAGASTPGAAPGCWASSSSPGCATCSWPP